MTENDKISYGVAVQKAKSEYKKEKVKAKCAYKLEKSELKFALGQSISTEHPELSPKLSEQTKADIHRAKQRYKSTVLEKKLSYKLTKTECKAKFRRQKKHADNRPPASLSFSLAAAFVLVFMLIMILQGAFVLYTVEYLSSGQCDRQLDTIYATLQSADFSEAAAQNACRNDISFISISGKYQAGDVKTVRQIQNISPSYHKVSVNISQYRVLCRQTPYGTLYIGKNLETENNIFALLLVVISVSIVLAAIASGVVGISISERCLRPIHSMSRMMKEITVSDLSARIDEQKINTELRQLAGNFNQMMDRLEQSYETQSQFVSDASHELRTPISVISGYADILNRWGSEDPAVLKEAIGAIGVQCAAINELLERLLTVSRTETGQAALDIKRREIYPIIKELQKDFSIVAGGRTLSLDVPRSQLVSCDAAALRQVLVVLLDNAVKFTAEDGNIRIFSEDTADSVLIGVADDGIGIPEDRLPKIFDRFYKADPARSQKGYGLGLSIAKKLCDAMQVEITVQSITDKGTTFTVKFPKK